MDQRAFTHSSGSEDGQEAEALAGSLASAQGHPEPEEQTWDNQDCGSGHQERTEATDMPPPRRSTAKAALVTLSAV